MTEPSLPLTCPKITKVVTVTSDLSLFDDSLGLQYCQNFGYSLSKEEVSLLTSLKHPVLVGCYRPEKETDEIVFDSCEFGSFSDLDVSKLDLSCHDLWSIRNQILQALKYLASHELYHKGINVSNVLVCSLHPIKVKLSLFSNGQILIRAVDTHIPIQELWKQKMNEQEEVCFDDLIRSIVKSVFPYSIVDKNIVFTNPNTLERNDLESLKALICSIESETMFKSVLSKSDFSIRNTSFSHLFKPFQSDGKNNLSFLNPVLVHVCTQGILRHKKPLLGFDFDNTLFKGKNEDFSSFATKMISISSHFRNVFFNAFDSACEFGGHCLDVAVNYPDTNCLLSCYCTTTSQLSSLPVVFLNWWEKLFITSLTTWTMNFDTSIISFKKISKLFLINFNEDLAIVTKFPTLSGILMSWTTFQSIPVVYDFNVLSSCYRLKSISIHYCIVPDLAPFSSITRLTHFSLSRVNITDFAPISELKKLTKLALNECCFSNLSLLSSLRQLEDLSCDVNNVSDLSPLSSLKQLSRLSLFKTSIYDLWPLRNLLKLSTLDLRETLLPQEHQRLLTNSSDIKMLINLFEHGVFGLDFSKYPVFELDLSLYSHCSRLRSLNLSERLVKNICVLSKFTNLETLDLSNVKIAEDNKPITDISFLSAFTKLRSLTLDGSKVTDLSPLSVLVELENLSLKNTIVFDLWPLKDLAKLSTLDLRETLLPKEHRRLLTNSSEIKALINSFKHGVFSLDFSQKETSYFVVDMSYFFRYSTLKSLNLSGRKVEDISVLSEFTELANVNLSNVILSNDSDHKITDISFLSSCVKVNSLSLDGSKVIDLSPLTFLVELERLSLKKTSVFDLWPLKNLTKLSTLDVRETLLPREHQRLLTNSPDIKAQIKSFEHGVFGLDFSKYYDTVNLFMYSHCSRLRSLNLSSRRVENIFVLSKFTNLETLDLSNVKIAEDNKPITDISFLSAFTKLRSLTLDGSKVTDLSPFSVLVELENLSLKNTIVFDLWPLKDLAKLSTLDLRETLLPKEHRRLLTNSSEIKALINSFEHGVDLDFLNDCSELLFDSFDTQ
ncbi:hypothetical protein RCL1_007952 [Eukaryota sp. TZLM3-RCL]